MNINNNIKWYQVNVEASQLSQLSPGLAYSLAYLNYKGVMYLSPHVRIAGDSAAMIHSKDLAQAYANACEPIFAKRGQAVTFKVVPCECPDTKRNQAVHARIEEHSIFIQARLDQNIMAPNKRPLAVITK